MTVIIKIIIITTIITIIMIKTSYQKRLLGGVLRKSVPKNYIKFAKKCLC